MDITYHDDIKLLGFHMTKNIQGSAANSWAMLTAKFRAQFQEAYHRTLNLEHRIRYIKYFLLTRAWVTTQIPPPPPPPCRLRPTDEHSHIMVRTEWHYLQIPVIHVTTAQRFRGQSSDTYNGKMYDTFHAANGEARTKNRYFHCRLAHELVTKWKNTESSTKKEDTNEIRPSLWIQHRIGIRACERNLWTPENLWDHSTQPS